MNALIFGLIKLAFRIGWDRGRESVYKASHLFDTHEGDRDKALQEFLDEQNIRSDRRDGE